MKTIKEGWVEVCDQYLRKFCEKHDLSYKDAFWIAEDAGSVVCIGDYCIDMGDIRYDIDNAVPECVFFEYEAYCDRIRNIELEYDRLFNPDREQGRLRHMNYGSFCKGAPGYTESELSSMEEELASVGLIREEFEKVCVASGK